MHDGVPARAGAAEFAEDLGNVRRLVDEALIPAEPRPEARRRSPRIPREGAAWGEAVRAAGA